MPIKPLLLSQHKQFEQLGALVGTLFNSSEWLKIYDNKLEQFGIFDNDNKLIGAFHLYKVKQYGLTYYKNPPFTPHIGLFYENKANNTANALTFEKNLIAEITDFIESLPY